MRPLVQLGAIAATITMLLTGSPLAAQDGGGPALGARDRVLARELFRQGMLESQLGEWDAARETFTRLHQLTHRVEVLLNLGTAQSESGHVVEAADSYRAFLRDASESLRQQHGASATAALERATARIAHLTIGAQLSAQLRVELDGEALEPSELGIELPVDPRAHEVVLRDATGTVLDQRRVTLGDGERTRIELATPEPPERSEEVTPQELASRADPELSPVTTAPVDASHGDDAWLIGLGVGGAALVVGGVVLVVVLTLPPSEPAGYSGSLGAFTSDASHPYTGTLGTFTAR